MRILVITNLYPPGFQGGYELGCSHVTDALRRAGHEVQVLTAGTAAGEAGVTRALALVRVFDPSLLRTLGAEERRALAVRGHVFEAGNLEALETEVSRFRPEAVYLWNLVGIGGLGIVGWLEANGLPWVWHLMDAVPRQLCTIADEPVRALSEAFALTASGRYLACSSHVLGEIRRGGFELRGDAQLVPNWVAGELPARRGAFFSAPGGTLRVVTAVGVLVEHKGIDLLIETAARLKEAGHRRFAIDLYGREDDDRFRTLASELGVGQLVTFRGVRAQRELMRAFSDYDVFAFPTQWREPFAFAPLEAAAAGCVPLISRNSGNAEWLIAGVNCLKSRRTPDAFADVLGAIMSGQIGLADVGRRAQAAIGDTFRLSLVLGAIERALSDAAASIPTRRDDRLLTAAMSAGLA